MKKEEFLQKMSEEFCCLSLGIINEDIQGVFLKSISYVKSIEDYSCWDDLKDYALGCIHEKEIIYYVNAIEYLKENDWTLMESLSIADECGFKPKDLDSEKLATLLYQRKLEEELEKVDSYAFNELFDAINNFVED